MIANPIRKFKSGDYVKVHPKGDYHPCYHIFNGMIAKIVEWTEFDDEYRYEIEWLGEKPHITNPYTAICGRNMVNETIFRESWLQPFDIVAYQEKQAKLNYDPMQEYLECLI